MVDLTHRQHIMLRTRRTAVRLNELAGPRHTQKSLAIRKVVQELEAQGKVRRIQMRFDWWIADPDWTPGPKFIMEMLVDRCRPVGGCLLWTGRSDRERGPLFTVPLQPQASAARRTIYELRTGQPLARNQCIRMTCDEHNCLEYGHMQCVVIGSWQVGTRKTLQHRKAIERYRRSISDINMDTARELRRLRDQEMQGSDEWSAYDRKIIKAAIKQWLATKYNLSPRVVEDVLSGRTWKEDPGVFAGLMQ